MRYSNKNIHEFTDLLIFEMVTNGWSFKLNDNGTFTNYSFTMKDNKEVFMYLSKTEDNGFNSAVFLLTNDKLSKQLNSSTVFFEGYNNIGFIKSEISLFLISIITTINNGRNVIKITKTYLFF